jgi:uncharacterized protein YjbI with pentapeptide repeats
MREMMANDEHLKILLEKGCVDWNEWLERQQYVQVVPWRTGYRADLSGADLSGLNFRNYTFSGVNLSNADLKFSDFTNSEIELAILEGALFEDTKISEAALIRGSLTEEQRAGINFIPPEIEENLIVPSDRIRNVSIRYAQTIAGPALISLKGLQIPVDADEFSRKLFNDLIQTIEDLLEELQKINDKERRLSQQENVAEAVELGLPVWKETWKSFITGAGGAAVGMATS